ncbi:MAG: thioesterase family protein [Mycobacteriales bacterium]
MTLPVQVRFGDLDPLGHVNNVAFYSLMETARVAFMTSQPPSIYGHVLVARSECEYLAEIPGATRSVDITVSVEKVGTTSFTVLHEIRIGERLVAVGRTVQVVVGEDGRPRPLTDDEREQLGTS